MVTKLVQSVNENRLSMTDEQFARALEPRRIDPLPPEAAAGFDLTPPGLRIFEAQPDA
jgi:hypothetical protein